MPDLLPTTRRTILLVTAAIGLGGTATAQSGTGYGAVGYGVVPYGPTPDDTDSPDIGDPITSEPEPEPELTITELTATEANPRNPHAEIEVEWTVEDTGGDLSDLIVRLENARGGLITRYGESLGGECSTGTWNHRIKHGGGQTYVVSILAETADGRTATDSVTI